MQEKWRWIRCNNGRNEHGESKWRLNERQSSLVGILKAFFSLRVLNKVLADFGEASLLGVKAIYDGQIAPMNPNESTRSQVYLHNNIFFSRAVDAGVETFKVAKGDRAARKSASRDVHCLGALHRMESTGLLFWPLP